MGGCVAREEVAERTDEQLLSRDGAARPFQFRVRFRPNRQLEPEAQVILSLTELLWTEQQPQLSKGSGSNNPVVKPLTSPEAATARCIRALRALRAGESEAVADFVGPVVNVVLHAPSQAVRTELWESFVLDAVNSDFALAHLFFWALRAVSTSPQASAATKLDADKKLDSIMRVIASRAQVAATLSKIAAANDALRYGKKLPEAHPSPAGGVTPLIDLLQRLHIVGEKIVPVKDKHERLQLLRRLLEEINEQMADSTPVPLLMLAPHGARRARNNLSAHFLRMPAGEARVLSSKARAPFLVVTEVDTREQRLDFGPGPSGLRALLGACSRRRPNGSAHDMNGWADRGMKGGSSSSSTTGLARMPPMDEEHEEVVKKYLFEQDQRPKGLFNYETWDEVVARVRETSSYGKRPNWSMLSWIVKSNADDVRQEELAYRLLRWFERVFRRHKLKLWLQPFLIIATSHDGGCLEAVTNAISLSDLKKSYGDRWRSLRAYFEKAFHLTHIEDPGSPREPQSPTGKKPASSSQVPLNKAILNFIWSMAGYSVVCYVLAIRDRHNGNILLDDEGHVIHVDFGFMLCGAPGGKALQKMGGFEYSRGFKLTHELVEVLGPLDHLPFQVFRKAVLDGMVAVRKHAEELLAILQLSMLGSENHQMNCFSHPRGYPEAVLEDVCERLGLPGGGPHSATTALSDEAFRAFIDRKIDDSVDHWRSWLYDKYQYHFTGIH